MPYICHIYAIYACGPYATGAVLKTKKKKKKKDNEIIINSFKGRKLPMSV